MRAISLLGILCIPPLPAQQQLASTFDSGIEGWTPYLPGCPIQYMSNGGNGGGFLFVDNPETVVCRLLASEEFRGGRDLTEYYGGTVSFDGKIFQALDETWDGRRGTGGEGFNYGTIRITGNGGAFQIDIVLVPHEPEPQNPPWNQWQTHTAKIVAGTQTLGDGRSVSWTDSSAKQPVTEEYMRAILKSVTSIDVNIEAIFGREIQGFDNFVLTGPACPTATPFAKGSLARFDESCPATKRPVPEEIAIDAETLSNGKTFGEVLIDVNGGPGFTESWTMHAARDGILVLPKTAGRAPGLVLVQTDSAVRDDTLTTLLWDFSGGKSYITNVTVHVSPPRTAPVDCTRGRDFRYLSWELGVPTSAVPWLKVQQTRPATEIEPGVYGITKDPSGLSEGTHETSIRGAAGEVCREVTTVPKPLPRINAWFDSHIDVFSDDQGKRLTHLVIYNLGKSELQWRVKPDPHRPAWLSLAEENGAVPSGETRRILASIDRSALPTDRYPRAVITLAAEEHSDTPASLSISRHNEPRRVIVEPDRLVITPDAPRTVTIANVSEASTSFSVAVGDAGVGLRATPSFATITPKGQVVVTFQVDSRLPRAAFVYSLIYIEGRSVQDTVRIVVPAEGATPPEAVGTRSASRRQAGCTPTMLTALVEQPFPNLVAAAGVSVPVSVLVLDDCGQPLQTGQVTVEPRNGDEPFDLIPDEDGYWVGSWTPFRQTTGFSGLVVTAFSENGALYAEARMPVAVDANPDPPPTLELGTIFNAASYVPLRPHAPGEFISLFGIGLADSQATASAFPLPTQLGGASVQIGGVNAPLLYAGPNQINAVVPFGIEANSYQPVIVRRGDQATSPGSMLIVPADPGVFTAAQTGAGPGIVTDANFRLIDAANPARAGDAVIILLTGLGETDPAVPTGAPTPLSPLSFAHNPVSVTIGGVSAKVLFAGLAPGFAGLYQLNVVVPEGVQPGDAAPVVITSAGLSSPPVTITVQ